MIVDDKFDYGERKLLTELLLLQRISLVLQCERIADEASTADEYEKRHAKFVAKAVSAGHLWALEWEGYGSYTVPTHVAEEVGNILTMWRVIVGGLDRLPQDDKEYVFREADPAFLKPDDYQFPGFDGNEESAHLAVTMFLVEEMNRFQELKDEKRDLNSHWPSLESYRRMLSVFREISGMKGLSKDGLIKVLSFM